MLELFFMLLNAAILFGALGYAMIKYGIPMFKEGFAREEQTRDTLHDNLNNALNEQKSLEQRIELQELGYDRLEQQIVQWNTDIAHQAAREKRMIETHRAQAKKRLVENIEHIQTYEDDLFLMPHIVAKTEELLRTHFRDDATAEKFTAKIIQRCRKELV